MRISRGHRHTLRICNNYCFSMASMVTRTRLNVTLYIHYVARLLLFRGGDGYVSLEVQPLTDDRWQNDDGYGKTEVRTKTAICPGAPFLTGMSHINIPGSGTVTTGWEDSYKWPEVWYSLFKLILKICLEDWGLFRQPTRGYPSKHASSEVPLSKCNEFY